MPLDPQKSREAHSQIRFASLPAALPISHPRDSLTCDLRGPHLPSCDKATTAGNPFPFAPGCGVVGQPLRSMHRSQIAFAMANNEMMAAECDDRPDPFEMLRQRIREDARRSARFRRIFGLWLPVVAGTWAALWFLFQILRGVL